MSAATDRAEVRVRVLGPVRLPTLTGDAVAAPGPLPTRMLVALALAGPAGMRADALIDAIWPDAPPRQPKPALQMLVSRVRAAAAPQVLVSTATGYALAATDLWDVERLALPDDPDGVIRITTDALAAWSGPAGDDVDDPELAAALADRARRAAHRLRTARAAAYLDAGRPAAALADLDVLTAEEPQAVEPQRLRMTALAAAGRTGEAIAAFATYRERLADAFGIDPDPALVALHTRLLHANGRQERGGSIGLRAATTPLLGRDTDVVQLLAGLETNRLTTIVGIGGLGKTRLAQEVGAQSVDRFDAVVFVELAGARTGEDVPLVIGATVGTRTAQTRRIGDTTPIAEPATRLRETLGAGRTLLILDNCEQVVGDVAHWAADTLAAVPTLTLLTTSRVPLAIAGEGVHPLLPLPAATDGTRLFMDRALAVRPDAALDSALVARLMHRLDGLPLAIELAAARLRSMTLDELDRRLQDRFAVLVGRDRTAPERHRTLFAVIDWSWQLLSQPDRDALAVLAVFPDGFTAESATALLGRDATDTLDTLVDQSLLTFGESIERSARYRMLETVREFGLRALEDRGDLADALARLDLVAIEISRRIAPGLLAGRDTAAIGRVTAEEETLLAVFRRSPGGREPAVVATFAVVAESWIYRGDFAAITAAIPMLLAVAGRRPRTDPERDDLLRALTITVAFTGVTNASAARPIALLRRCVAALPRSAQSFWPVLARTLADAASTEATRGTFRRLSTSADPMVATFASLLDAQFDENAGDTDAALASVRRALTIAEREGYTWFRTFAVSSIAQLHSQRAERSEALQIGREAWAQITSSGLGGDLEQMDWMLAANEAAVGELDAAEARFTALTTRGARSVDADDLRAIGLAGLAEVATSRGAPDAAATWTTAVRAARHASPPWRVVVSAAALAAAMRAAEPGILPPDAAGAYRRLRSLVLALARLGGPFLDAPVLGSGLLGLTAVLLVGPDAAGRAAGRELAQIAVFLGARRDLASIDRVVQDAGVGTSAPDLIDRPAAMTRALALLREPAVRR